MSKEKLFRETPFNGYNRDDVADYIAEMDNRYSQERKRSAEEIESLRSEVEEKASEIEKLNAVVSSLNFALDEKTHELEALSAEAEKTEPAEELSVFAEPESLPKTSGQEEQIARLKEKLAAAEAEIADRDNQLREYIEKVCLLEAAEHSDEEVLKKLADAEKTIEEKDRKIEFLRQGWDQYKKNYGKYLEVADSAEAILAKAREEANQILAAAEESASGIKSSASQERESLIGDVNGEVQLLIANAVRESGKIIATAEEKAKSVRESAESSAAQTKEKLSLLRSSMSGLVNSIDLAVRTLDEKTADIAGDERK